MIQKGKEMIALFIEPIAHGFFVRFAAGRLQQLNGFVLEGLTQITEGLRAKLSFLLLECDGGTQHCLPLRIRSPHPLPVAPKETAISEAFCYLVAGASDEGREMSDALYCPKYAHIFRTLLSCIVRNMHTYFGHIPMTTRTDNLKDKISRRIAAKKPFAVWTPTDFLDLGSREAVDKTLQRLARRGEVRRIDRGLYDKPVLNSLTKKRTSPDYRELINVVSRRDRSRMLLME